MACDICAGRAEWCEHCNDGFGEPPEPDPGPDRPGTAQEVLIVLHPQTCAMVEALTDAGLGGLSPADTVAVLVTERIRQLMAEGVLTLRVEERDTDGPTG